MLRSSLVASLATSLLIAFAPAASADDVVVTYLPPVDGPVIDDFRPPLTRYAAGNRGIDFATASGATVRVAADGVVVFAGRIGRTSHVVVRHTDGVRTSYSFLASIAVRRGEQLEQGDAIGTAASAVHFGARIGDEYLDPARLLADGPPRVHLVPVDRDMRVSEARERRSLIRQLGGLVSGAARTATGAVTTVARVAGAAGWEVTESALRAAGEHWRRIDEGLRAWAHVANRVTDHAPALRRRWERVLEDQTWCTPSTTPAPTGFDRRRIAVLVGGLGSSGGHAAILDVDTGALGYGPGDVMQLSYAGGQVPLEGRTVDGVPVRDYDRAATWDDLRVAGAHLRQVLRDLAVVHPGVAVDILAHSQGGIVARAALAGADLWDPSMPVVENLVTLGSPHHGAIGSTAAAALGLLPRGELALGAAHAASDGSVPAGVRSVRDLSSSSRLIVDDLGNRSPPAGTSFTSIAASGDLVVDAQMSAVDDATNVVVHLEGLHAHDRLPGHPDTARELALALHGMGPTCRDRPRLLDDLVLADTINLANGVRYVGDLVARAALVPIAPLP